MSGRKAKAERRRCKRNGCEHAATHQPVILLRHDLVDPPIRCVVADIQVCTGDRGSFSLPDLLKAVGPRLLVDYRLQRNKTPNLALTRLEFVPLDRFGNIIPPPPAPVPEALNPFKGPTVELQPDPETPPAPAEGERPN